jgi:hypothetical protein
LHVAPSPKRGPSTARLRKQADVVRAQVATAIKDKIGPVQPFTETYDFQCDNATDAEMAALPQQQLVDRLLAARNIVDGPLTEIDRSYWGDLSFLGKQPIHPGPGAWTGRERKHADDGPGAAAPAKHSDFHDDEIPF